jgi:hypothetical protein
MILSSYRTVAGAMIALLSAGSGWLLHAAAVWLIRHDSIYYRLYDSNWAFIARTADSFFFIGQTFSTLGFLCLGLPVALGYWWEVRPMWRLIAVNLAAGFCLLGTSAFVSSATAIFVLLTGFLWALAWALALIPSSETLPATNS